MISKFGACSEIRNGNFIARSYDWNYSNNCGYLVRTPAKAGRHASIGISSVNVTEQEMSSKIYNENLKLIPYQLLDGINDCGVYCGTNVVPAGDKGITTGTHPGKENLPQIAIPRLVVDKAGSAKEAIKLLENRNIYSIVYDGTFIELHMLICDKDDTFIVEFVNNEMVVNSYEDQKAIMTNFYVSGWNGEIKAKWLGNTDEEIKETGLTNHADGLERYNILKDGMNSMTSLDTSMKLIKEVLYTKAYDKSMNPFWYSELVGSRGLTIYNTAEEYAPVVDIFVQRYEERDRNNPITWQSVHQSVYDLEKREMWVTVQEGEEIHKYTLGEIQ